MLIEISEGVIVNPSRIESIQSNNIVNKHFVPNLTKELGFGPSDTVEEQLDLMIEKTILRMFSGEIIEVNAPYHLVVQSLNEGVERG